VLFTQDFVIPQVAREDAVFGILVERDGVEQLPFPLDIEQSIDSGGGGGGGGR